MRTKLILLSILLASCSGLSIPLISPYKMDIHQGNVVTPAMREKLKLGMSKQQVRYVLGTPLVNDAFHGNRWDYIYRLEHGGKVVEKQNLTLHFGGDNLVRIDDGNQSVQAAPVIVAPETATSPKAAEPAVVPAVAEAPQPPPVAKADPAADVRKSVQDWAAAWSSRDVARYLASYADTFKPSSMTRDAWQIQRKARIGKAHAIKVEISGLEVKMQDDSHAMATFKQSYRSDTYKDELNKKLELEKIGDAWLIVSEQTSK